MEAGVVIQAYLKDARRDLADDDRLLRRPPAAAHRPPGEGCVLGHRDRPRPGRGLAGPGLRPQGGDRRQLRALRRPAARQPRHRCGPPSAATTCARSATPWPTPGTRASPTAATRSSCSTGWRSPSTPPSGAWACACASTPRSASWCPAWPTWCGGCWRTPPTRASCAAASSRVGTWTSCSPRPESTTCPSPSRRCDASRPTRPTPPATRPSRWPSGAAPRSAPHSPPPSRRSTGRR